MILAALEVNLFKNVAGNALRQYTSLYTHINTHTHTYTYIHTLVSFWEDCPHAAHVCKYTVHSLRLFMTDLCCCASNTFQAYCGL